MRFANEDLIKRITRLLQFHVDSRLRSLEQGEENSHSCSYVERKQTPRSGDNDGGSREECPVYSEREKPSSSDELHDTFVENTARTIALMAREFSRQSKISGRKLKKASDKYTKDLIKHAARHILLFVGGFATKALSSLVTSACWLLCQPQNVEILEKLREEVRTFVGKPGDEKFSVERLDKLELLDQVRLLLCFLSPSSLHFGELINHTKNILSRRSLQ